MNMGSRKLAGIFTNADINWNRWTARPKSSKHSRLTTTAGIRPATTASPDVTRRRLELLRDVIDEALSM